MQIRQRICQSIASKTLGTNPQGGTSRKPLSSLQFALIVVTDGQLVTVKTVLHNEKLQQLLNSEVCRKTKVQMKQESRVKDVDDTEASTIGTSAAAGEQANQIEIMLQRHSIYDANYDSDYDEFDDNCVAVISGCVDMREVEPFNMHNRIGNTEMKAFVVSGSVCSIINRSLANAVVLNSQECFWVQSPENPDLKTFSTELIKTIVVINTSEKCNDWAAVNVNVTFFEDGYRPVIGRDLFPQLGFSLTQTKQASKVDQHQSFIEKQIAFEFPGSISRW